MENSTHILEDGKVLVIREALLEDAGELINFVHHISAESDFLTFGAGEFDIEEDQEKELIQTQLDSENQIYLLATIEKEIVAILNFSARNRPRIRHSGELSMVIQKKYWDLGIGSILVDTLIQWARSTHIIKKINLRVRIDNQRAIHLYVKKGFVKEGTLRKEIYVNGTYYDLVWMGMAI